MASGSTVLVIARSNYPLSNYDSSKAPICENWQEDKSIDVEDGGVVPFLLPICLLTFQLSVGFRLNS